MAKVKTIKVEADVGGAKTALGQIVDLFKSMVKEEKEAQKQAEETGDAVEEIGKKSSKARNGVKKLGTGFKNLGKAIAVSGIGLIVGLFGLLKTAFEGNAKAQKVFSIGADYVNAVVGEMVDLIDSVVTKVSNATNGFESLGKVLSGVLTLALTPIKLAFLGIGKSIVQAQLLWEKSPFGGGDQGKIKELEDSLNNYNDKIIKVGIDSVKAGKDIVENFGGAISEVGQLGKAVVDELGNVDVQASILRKKTEEAEAEAQKKAEERRKKAIEKKKAEEDAEANRIAEGKRRLLEIEKQYTQGKEDLDAVTRTQQLELEKQRAIEDLEALNITGEEYNNAKLALDKFYNEKKILLDADLKAENDQKDADDYADGVKKKKKEEKKEIERDKVIQNAKIGLATQSFEVLGALAEEGSALAKGVQVAQTIMSTIQGVQSAYTSAQGSPYAKLFPAYPYVQAGLAGAFGAISVQKILATPTKSTGGGAPSQTGGGSTPPPAFNLVGGSGVDEIGDLGSAKPEPVKAYVVGADVTNQQEVDNAQSESASLG